MTEAVALAKFPCPACGAEATWNPAKQRLVCSFCGTESPAPIDSAATIVEHDLLAAIHSGVDAEAPPVHARQVKCRSCNALSVLDPARQAQQCPFCGSAQLVAYTDDTAAYRPESVLPFRVSEPDARDRIRSWYGKLWLAPNALKRQALTDTVRGVYLPYWTFDARVEAAWTAEAGHFYYTTETYTENGRVRTRSVQHVRWEPAAGRLSHFFDDDLVCASAGVHPGLLRGIEPFPTRDLKPYDPGYVAGWVVERYQVDLVAAARQAREDMEAEIEARCGSAVPGDTHRNLSVRCDFSGQTFKHVLCPIWLMTYHYGTRGFQCVINGVTGSIKGEYPKSPWKVAALVLAAVVVVCVLLVFAGQQ